LGQKKEKTMIEKCIVQGCESLSEDTHRMYPDSEIERLRSGFHARVVGDLKDGLLTYAEIAYKYGISAATVYHLARKHGCRHRADSAPQQRELK
jgi:predicted DNA-binding transcriptional regulator AlpA